VLGVLNFKNNPALYHNRSCCSVADSPLLNLATWNARSITTKIPSICDFITSNNIYVFAITETWMTGDNRDTISIAELNTHLPNFNFLHKPRTDRRGGGISLCLHNTLHFKEIDSIVFDSFEYVDLVLTSSTNLPLRLVTIYRPQLTSDKRSTSSIFLDDFQTLMESINTKPSRLLICGDFNYHMDDPHSSKFTELIDSFNLVQHVHTPTHEKGHILDLIITRSLSDIVSNDVYTSNMLPSDHAAILCALKITQPPAQMTHIKKRILQDINFDSFRSDILNSPLYDYNSDTNIDTIVNQYDVVLTNILDKHAPIIHRYVKSRPFSPWYTKDLKHEKTNLRKLERTWKKSKLTVHRLNLKQAANNYKIHLNKAKRDYLSNQFAVSDPKSMFRLVNKLTNTDLKPTYPSSYSDPDLANSFLDYFTQKVSSITNSLHTDATTQELSVCQSNFYTFTALPDNKIKQFITSSSSKTSRLDVLPSTVFQECVNELIPLIIRIVNLSLQTGQFPHSLKFTVITPRLKKSTLDPETFSNYRPIANIKRLAKIIEKAAVYQLTHYLNTNHLFSIHQSAYRRNHSTETALLKVYNDLLQDLDVGNEALRVLLDYSAAFDTINHETFLNRLTSSFGISDNALNWFKSYFANRPHSIAINDSTSRLHISKEGVPQGSIIGPLSFILYTSQSESIVTQHQLNNMTFADDNQIYGTIRNISTTSTVENCVNTIKKWSNNNQLKLNENKTVIIHLSSRHRKKKNCIPHLSFGESNIVSSAFTTNLGVVFDEHLTLVRQINAVVRSANFALYNVAKLRSFLTPDITLNLIYCYFTSRIDYCNSLFIGLPTTQISKLQKLQNSAVRLIFRLKPRDHVTPYLIQLHWLPVRYRIEYKVILLTFKCLKYDEPLYIRNLLNINVPIRSLRSSFALNLDVPKTKTTYGDRSFMKAAAVLWNNLPTELKTTEHNLPTFKSLLKTHQFRLAFPV
jgi:exonuclease III/uncharacterized surface protein with fasciclin (FAS1) repeats